MLSRFTRLDVFYGEIIGEKYENSPPIKGGIVELAEEYPADFVCNVRAFFQTRVLRVKCAKGSIPLPGQTRKGMNPWTSSLGSAIPEMGPWSPVLVGFPGYGKDMHRRCVGLGEGREKTKGRSSLAKLNHVRLGEKKENRLSPIPPLHWLLIGAAGSSL